MENANPIAVIWYDGSQECKILNVSPREHTDANEPIIRRSSPECSINVLDENTSDDNDNGIRHNDIISRGIDNTAFVGSIETSDSYSDYINENLPSCSSDIAASCSSSGSGTDNRSVERNANRTSIQDTTRSPSPCSSVQSTSSRNGHFSHDNPAFEMPHELSYDAVVKRSPIHPNVYLVRKRSSANEPTTCTCPSNDVILQVRPTEYVDEINSAISSKDNETNDCKLHFIKRVSPVCNVHICETSSDIKKTDEEEPPPNYSSLRFMFLEDEPPKYQDVTGKKLAMGDPPKMHHDVDSKWKRRIIVFAVIVFIILIGALLVYACFVSGHPLGAYGSVPRKF